VLRLQGGHQRRRVIGLEVRPVQRHHGFGPLPQQVGPPKGEEVSDVDAPTGEQSVHLLHSVLPFGASCNRQGLADGIDREAGGLDTPQRRQRERQHPLGLEVLT